MIVESIESIPSTFICSKYKFSLCRKYKCSLNTKYILQIAHFLIPQRAPAASQRAKLNPSDSELNVMWNTSDSDVEYTHVILNTSDCGVEYNHVMLHTSDCGVESTFHIVEYIQLLHSSASCCTSFHWCLPKKECVAALKDIRDMMGFDPGDGNGNGKPVGAYLEIGPHAHISYKGYIQRVL